MTEFCHAPLIVTAFGTGDAVVAQVQCLGDERCISVYNTGDKPVAVREVVLGSLQVDPHTPFFGEGYNMLSMYAGTLASPRLTGSYGDDAHYRMPQTPGCFTVYNLLCLHLQEGYLLLTFTTCRRFRGEFRLFPDGRVQAVLCCEDMVIPAGGTVQLEEFAVYRAANGAEAYARFAKRAGENHPPLPVGEKPIGWCSWYCYGPEITRADIEKNMAAMAQRDFPGRYVLIDDGYQAHMGDWLEDSDKLGTSMKALCRQIRDGGMEPAIWLAPFIADKDSRLLQEHPDWFVQGDDGAPLPSDRVTFGGWRLGPWYMLDTSHPDACGYLRHVFSYMKREYGCRYFKLDANMWGAMPFGKRYDPSCTAIEAYRRGMEAILEAVGDDSFVLGCNAPMWPSMGLVHGMRVSTDIFRSWEAVDAVAYQCFHRQYQHGRLWMNDPDCMVYQDLLINVFDPAGEQGDILATLSEKEKQFHLTAAMAVGGLVFTGDRVCDWSEQTGELFCRLLQLNVRDTVFLDDDCTVAKAKNGQGDELWLVFNPTDAARELRLPLSEAVCVTEFWSGREQTVSEKEAIFVDAHEARIYTVSAKRT